jgi:major vault protein
MVFGPCRYIPPVEVILIEKRKSIPLDTNEGIYVRDNREGSIRAECGKTYML